jgi:hypothetical protein
MMNPDFLQTHTCRNFQKLKSWATDHDNEVKESIRASRKGKEQEDVAHGGHETDKTEHHHS